VEFLSQVKGRRKIGEGIFCMKKQLFGENRSRGGNREKEGKNLEKRSNYICGGLVDEYRRIVSESKTGGKRNRD